jgi:transposase
MSGFIEGEDRNQATLFPERIDDYITKKSAVRVIDVFVDELDLSGLGFKAVPEATGRPGYHPALMLKLFSNAFVEIDGSKFRAVNNRNKNFSKAKLKVRMLKAPGQQLSQTDPDARAMATIGRGKGIVGYNMQAAVDTTHT